MVYTLRLFSSKCSLFHNSNVFGSIIHILYTGCAKIKKKIIPAPKGIWFVCLCLHVMCKLVGSAAVTGEMVREEGAWVVCVGVSYTGDGGQLGSSFLWNG